MKASVFLALAEALPFADLPTLIGDGGLVVVAPHPDDESLGCGGLIAAARARGADVRLLVVSDGVGSHRNSASHPPERLRTLREAETIEAAAALGLEAAAIRFLRLPDAAVPTVGREADAALDAIVEAAVACAAGAVCVTWRHDPHCDHGAAATLVERARPRLRGARVHEYPIWGWTLPEGTEVGAGPSGDGPSGARLDIAAWVGAKRAAVAAHRSQTTALIADDPQGFRLDATMLERFARPFEIYLDVSPGANP